MFCFDVFAMGGQQLLSQLELDPGRRPQDMMEILQKSLGVPLCFQRLVLDDGRTLEPRTSLSKQLGGGGGVHMLQLVAVAPADPTDVLRHLLRKHSESLKHFDTVLLRYLIRAGALLEEVEQDWEVLALRAAHKNRNAELLQTLLVMRVDVLQVEQMQRTRTAPLLEACSRRADICIRVLLEARADPQTVAPNGSFPLLLACEAEHTLSVKTLLEARAEANQTHERSGESPLLHVSRWGDSRLVQMLLDFRADPRLPNRRSGDFALRAAVQQGHADCAQALLAAGADANQVSWGHGSIHPLQATSDVDCRRLLIEARADPMYSEGSACHE